MKTVVIYHSQTGFARRYAQWIAEAVGADCFSLSQAKGVDFSPYEAVIYGSWACAGRISKLGWFKKRMRDWTGKRLAVFCVGPVRRRVRRLSPSCSGASRMRSGSGRRCFTAPAG